MTEEERDERRRKRAALLLLPLFLLGAGCCFWSLFANVALGEAESFIPAPLGSDALANYGEDEITGRLRSLSISIVEAVIRDRDPEEENAGARATDVSESLKSPVPTVTPKPGDPTGTPTSPPTTTSTPDLLVTGTTTAMVSPSPSPFPSRTPTPTKTDVPSSTPGPTATPTPCGPVITIIAPLDGATYTLADDLPGQAIAYDPDCSPGTPAPDGTGIDQVDFEIKSEASGWSVVHYEDQFSATYCAFQGTSTCNTHSLSSGQWPPLVSTPPPTPEPIELGWHKLYARAKDNEGIWSSWVYVDFYLDPAPTSTPTPTFTPTATPTSTATGTPTPTPTDTPVTNCSSITLTGFSQSGQDAWWTLTNGTALTIKIDRIDLSAPGSEDLSVVKLAGITIWSGDLTPPLTINSGWSGSTGDRQLSSGSSKEFRLVFESNALSSGYTLDITFDTGCVASFSN
ncbi:MAG: hypothetical protein ACE5JF_10600 [Anaerolineales bacterium]